MSDIEVLCSLLSEHFGYPAIIHGLVAQANTADLANRLCRECIFPIIANLRRRVFDGSVTDCGLDCDPNIACQAYINRVAV